MAQTDFGYVSNGYQFSRADIDVMSFPGVTDDDIKLLACLQDHKAKAEPGFLVDPYGIRTRTTSLWPDARKLDGLMLGFPHPGNFHWEAIEWVGLMKAVLGAKNRFRIMELGAGWGPAVVSGGVLARLRGITDIGMAAVEGDPHHFRFLRQHLADNGFNPADHALYEAAIGDKPGTAQWPVTNNSSDQYGFRPIMAEGDYMDRIFAKTRTIKIIVLPELLRAEEVWDMVHIDIQGAETDVCTSAIQELNARARRVLVGTHSRRHDADILDLFNNHGWLLEHEKPCKFTFWPNQKSLEAMTTVDGTQVWRNPRL